MEPVDSDAPTQSAIESAFDAFVSTAENGAITEWNAAAHRLFGWSRAEVVGRDVAEVAIPPKYRDRYRAELRQARDASDARALNRRAEMSVMLRGGTEIPAEITVWVDRRAGRLRVNAFVRDLRERAGAESLRSLLAAVVESSDDAIITKTLDGVITSWNAGAERIFGYTADEVIGRPVTIVIPEDRLDEERYILANLRAGNRIDHYETVRVTKDGRLIDVALTISPLRDASGNITGASKILRDVTERKSAERALQEERQLLELLNQASRTLASNLDLTQLLQAVTDIATRMSGADFGALLHKATDGEVGSYEVVTASSAAGETLGQFRQSLRGPLLAAALERHGALRVDDVLTDPRDEMLSARVGVSGDPSPVRSYLAVPVVSRAGDVIGGLFFGHMRPGVFTERTERFVSGLASHAAIAIDNARLFEERTRLLESERSAREQAERLSTSKDEFVATLSHELRTPLNNILGWTQIMRSGKATPEDMAKAMEIIERNVRLQTQLVDDLLDMSRIVSGHMRIDVQTIMPMSFMHAAVDSLRPSAESRGVRLEAMLDPNAGPVSGDPGRLQQVVSNLLSNAIKFTPRGGRVQVSLARVNSHVEIRVSDTGIGIAPELLPHVFDRFRQADSSTVRRHSGLGLGLAIVRHIVGLHGGEVHAHSPGPGHGASFRVMLPIAVVVHRDALDGSRVHPRTSLAASTPAPTADLTGVRVLVVDDEADARGLIRRVLEETGATVTTVGSAAEAIEVVAAFQPDVIVSDIGMPEMDGYEMLRRIRTLGPDRGGRAPAIALTAFARSEDRTRALLSGYLAHVSKPVDSSEIVATVATIAGRTG